MRTVVIGLGNTILSDDGVGVYVARELRERLSRDSALESIDVIEAELAGLDMMEILSGYDRAVIVDSIELGGFEPGTVFRLSPDDFRTTPRLASFHDIDLVTALELGRRLDLEMPSEVVIYAVQAEDTLTLGEGCTPAVEAVRERLVNEIEQYISGDIRNRVSIDLCFRKS